MLCPIPVFRYTSSDMQTWELRNEMIWAGPGFAAGIYYTPVVIWDAARHRFVGWVSYFGILDLGLVFNQGGVFPLRMSPARTHHIPSVPRRILFLFRAPRIV